MSRQRDGRETRDRLLNWGKGQASSEGLSAQILEAEGFYAIDPQHPLGGPDGLKDIICKKDEKQYIASCYFPHGKKFFNDIKNKLKGDSLGIKKNKVDGIVFITNQPITATERKKLDNTIKKEGSLDLFHLERTTHVLNRPANYGTRLEYLDVEMTKEEQLAFMASKDTKIFDLINKIEQLIPFLPDNIKMDSMTVVPEALASRYSLSYSPNALYHKCSYKHCGYGFKVAASGFMNSFSISSWSFMTEKRVVTCPKCGNVDEIY